MIRTISLKTPLYTAKNPDIATIKGSFQQYYTQSYTNQEQGTENRELQSPIAVRLSGFVEIRGVEPLTS
jgi:hypothetical protein